MIARLTRLLVPALASVLLVLPLASYAEVASAVCADPRGDAYCSNGGLVNVPNPSPGQVNVANPNPGQVNVANPNPGQVNVPNPNPGQVSVPNPNPGQVNVPNPNPGQVSAPNPNPAQSAPQAPTSPDSAPVAPGLSVRVNPPAGGPGDTIAVVGQGFSANGRGGLVFINLVDTNGVARDTNYKAITCVNTSDWLLNLYQDLGWGCSGDASGPLTNSSATGGFTAAFTVPDGVAAGDGKVCIASVFSNPVCTPFTIASAGQAPSDTSPDQTGTDDAP